MKKIIPLIISVSLVLAFTVSTGAMNIEPIKIKVLIDAEHPMAIEMLLIDKMGYLYMTDVAEIFNAKLSPGKKSGQKVLDMSKGKAIFTVDRPNVIINWVERRMNKSPLLIEGRTVIPLEGVLSSAFVNIAGRTVTWNYSTKTLRIISKSSPLANEDPEEVINITSVKIYPHRNYTRSVIKLSEDLTYKSTRVEDKKLFIRINKGSINMEDFSFSVDDSLIKEVKSLQETDSVLIEFLLGDDAGGHIIRKYREPYKIVVDIREVIAVKEDIVLVDPKTTNKKIKTIVIDPGHGGKDPGAIGPNGTKEKDIVLKIARYLARLLKDRLNVKVIMTRNSDIFIPLAQRTLIANQKRADLFISIHANASLRKATRGFEVYFLSEKATDDAAQAVANIENSSLELEGFQNKANELSRILGSLAKNEFMNDSSEACSFIKKAINKHGKIDNRGVKQAGFFVLRGAEMPAILAECAFISNPNEESKLKSSWFQKNIAKSIASGILNYKKMGGKAVKMINNTGPIGVFDSGVGGLTVLSEIFKQLPGESIYYFGDTAHLPYGTKSGETVTGYSLEIVDFLIKKGVKLIVVACNTASSYSITSIKEKTEIPIVDVITPGSKAVISLTKNKKIGIIGTTATIRSKSYEKSISKLDPGIEIFTEACPLFVPLVEEGWLDGQINLLTAKKYLSPLKKENIDTLVLGCTHYPLLKKIITRVMGLKVSLVDSAEETAREVKKVLKEKKLLNEDSNKQVIHKYFVSDDPEKFSSLGKLFLGSKISDIKKIEL